MKHFLWLLFFYEPNFLMVKQITGFWFIEKSFLRERGGGGVIHQTWEPHTHNFYIRYWYNSSGLPCSGRTNQSFYTMMDNNCMRKVSVFSTFLWSAWEKKRSLEQRGSVTPADIESYRGSVRCEKEFPRVYFIMGKLHTKNEGPKSRDYKVTKKLKNGQILYLIEVL